MSYAWAITIVIGTYFAGTYLSKVTRGRIGSSLFCTFVFLIAFNLNIFPRDIVAKADLSGMYNFVMLTLLVNIGSTFDLKMLKNEWRLVVSVLLGIVGMAVAIVGIGGFFFGELAVLSFPTLVGGSIATQLMVESATEKGLIEMAALIVLINSVQAWLGMPLISYGVRKEANRMLGIYQKTGQAVPANRFAIMDSKVQSESTETTFFDKFLPKQCQNTFFYLFITSLCGAAATVIAKYTSAMTGGILGSAIIGLFLGCGLTHFGILPKDPLKKSGLLDFMMFVLIVVLRGKLGDLSMATLAASVVPIAGIVILGALGMLVIAIPVGRKLGFSTGMCVAFGMGCYCSYPTNYQIASEIINVLAEKSEEKEHLEKEILTRVVEGSIISVSMTSAMIAGLMAGFV